MSPENNQKFDPVREFITLRDSLTRSVNSSLKAITGTVATFPAVNIYETDTELIIYSQAITGLTAASVEIAVEDSMLILTIDLPEPEHSGYLLQEIPAGQVQRQIPLERPVLAHEAHAAVKNGVLTITLPKAHA